MAQTDNPAGTANGSYPIASPLRSYCLAHPVTMYRTTFTSVMRDYNNNDFNAVSAYLMAKSIYERIRSNSNKYSITTNFEADFRYEDINSNNRFL